MDKFSDLGNNQIKFLFADENIDINSSLKNKIQNGSGGTVYVIIQPLNNDNNKLRLKLAANNFNDVYDFVIDNTMFNSDDIKLPIKLPIFKYDEDTDSYSFNENATVNNIKDLINYESNNITYIHDNFVTKTELTTFEDTVNSTYVKHDDLQGQVTSYVNDILTAAAYATDAELNNLSDQVNDVLQELDTLKNMIISIHHSDNNDSNNDSNNEDD